MTMDSMDNYHGQHGQLLSVCIMDIVHGYNFPSMDKCFNTPWTMSMLKSMESHGQSVAG
ncbi:hypothetical protein DPMN_017684 [Dreissena polymorpha]|uniref:Uncharacterized protein n=1 Tax=Dreissena polymorpha TaxID=45954 RepID=A0A9D4S6L8_DREPO|nr:hypothetical protein DPMN_017684 [Dreissena polymorpha]